MELCKSFFYVAFLSILVTACPGAEKKKSEEQKQHELMLKNKIRKVSEYHTSVLLGVQQTEQLSSTTFFNSKGLPEKEIGFNSSGQEDLIKTYTYDLKNNLVLVAAVSKDSALLFKETNSYDSKNNRIEHYHYLADGTFKYKNIAVYDSKNRMTELSWYWPSGFRSKNVYTYDGYNKITDTEYSETGGKTYQWEYKYDAANNLIQTAQYYPGNVLTVKITYEYNQQGQLIKQTDYQGENVSSSIVFNYDGRNLLTSKTEYTPSGKVSAITRYTYE